MMTEQDFEDLAVHLHALEPAFESFCSKYGFMRVWGALGRYPRIRIERETDITVWFDLWMSLTPDGEKYARFFDSIPYDLSGGANVMVESSNPYGRMCHVAFSIWDRKPFSEITLASLFDAMAHFLPQLETWDVERLRSHGHDPHPYSSGTGISPPAD